MSANALITKYFPPTQRNALALSLATSLDESPQDIALLADLLPLLDETCRLAIYPRLQEFAIRASKSGDEDSVNGTVLLVEKYPGCILKEAVLSHALLTLKESIFTYEFIPGFQRWIGSYASDIHWKEFDTRESLLPLFQLLSAMFMGIKCDFDPELDRVLALFLGHRDLDITSSCSKLLRWRTESVVRHSISSSSTAQFYWDLVFELTSDSSPSKYVTHGYVLWLRLLNTASAAELKSHAYFQDSLISKYYYWSVLQKGLASSSHEARKFCLSLLQLSLKLIGCSFDAEILSWDTSKEKQLLREWSKFTTLFEVLGIDTSLHQTQAAYHDILAIITPGSLVHASWGFCLLATGFQASIDSVRKYSMHILLSIKKENLRLIQFGLPYLEEYYLPYMMLTRHFAVRTEHGVSKKTSCGYAESFSSFIASIFLNLKTPEEIDRVSKSLLSVLVDRRETFDAVRIYATLGMIKGLNDKTVLSYGVHDELLVKLFDNFSEGELFWRVVQTLNLRLILSFKLTSLHEFGVMISKFNSFNGFEIFEDNLPLIARYLVQSEFSADDLVKYSAATELIAVKVAFIRIAAQLSGSFSFSDDFSSMLVSQLAESGAQPSLENLTMLKVIRLALEDKETEEVYLSLSLSKELPIPNDSSLLTIWSSIITENLSNDYSALRRAHAKFGFLNKVIQDNGFLGLKTSLLEILELSQNIFCNSAECARNVTSFYKFKDGMIGELHRFLASFVQHTSEGCHLSSIIPIILFGSTHMETLSYTCDILKVVFDRNDFDEESLMIALTGLSEAVMDLDAERFKLSDRSVHTKLINIMLHDVVLSSAVHNVALGDIVLAFSEIIILNSYGRRGLMPTLIKAMSDYQVKHPAAFEELDFLPQFLVKAISQKELQVSAYKIEALVGKVYDSQLAPNSSLDIFTEVYGVDEVAYKVWLLSIINSIQSPEASKRVLDFIFDESASFTVIKNTDGVEEHARVQVSKIVISLIGNLDSVFAVETYLEKFIALVETDPSPLVRVYFEWAIARLLLAEPQYASLIFKRLEGSIKDHEVKPILVIAYERILFLMVQSMDCKNAEVHLTKLITTLVSAASTNKAVTRHFSMSLAMSVHDEIQKKSLGIDENLRQVIENMYKSALATDAHGQFRSGDAHLWNITEDFNLVNISGGILLRLFDREVDFLTRREFDFLTDKQKEILNVPIGKDQSNLWVRKLKEESESLKESSDGVISPLQTKSGAWSTIMDVDEKPRGSDVRRSELIVVASLVDKPPNLGGICRLCDVLGAGLMTVHDIKVKLSQQFKSVAVTADFWMPMAEVKPTELVPFLREKKSEGYTLVGLEQTDKSVVLDENLKFPKRSLLLLGREKEGIPGELLAELDFCVEIKQVGVVRSMNIQTATAVVVHAYSSQNC